MTTAMETATAYPVARSTRSRVAQPALLFIVLSLIFGGLIVALNPPLRAPDEPAHFLRAYGLSRGELIPTLEVNGRKGLYIPADLHDQFDLFFRAVEQGLKKTSWPRVYEQFRLMRQRPEAEKRPDVFIPYQGSEGYTPAAYLPHVPAALVARLLNLDFLTTIMLMRAAGLVFMTAIAAYAILITPRLKWAFFLIAMLPSALYGRSIIGADGGSLSYAMIVTALCLRAIYDKDADRTGARAFWMLLCALAKPPQLAMILLEPMVRRGRDWPRAWKSFAIVMLPSMILSPLWIYLVSADAAVWRLTDGGYPPEQFTIRWKAAFMLDDPWHFPAAMITTVTEHWYGLWREFFGKLGWLDSPLNDWIYVFLNVALIGVMLEKLDLDWRVRLRIAFWSVATFIGYAIAVFLVLFIMWTPVPTTQVGGVQGRYFIVVLPALALLIAALLPTGLNQRTLAPIAIIGSLVAAFAAIEILWRTHWA